MAISVNVDRNSGHPWDGRPGFDLMFVDAGTPAEMATAAKEAERKFWAPWLVGMNEATGKPGGVFYKPSGALASWEDSPRKPHPGASHIPL